MCAGVIWFFSKAAIINIDATLCSFNSHHHMQISFVQPKATKNTKQKKKTKYTRASIKQWPRQQLSGQTAILMGTTHISSRLQVLLYEYEEIKKMPLIFGEAFKQVENFYKHLWNTSTWKKWLIKQITTIKTNETENTVAVPFQHGDEYFT